MIAVVCKNIREYKQFLLEVELEDRSKFKQVSRLEHTYGVKFSTFIRLYDYQSIPNYGEIIHNIRKNTLV